MHSLRATSIIVLGIVALGLAGCAAEVDDVSAAGDFDQNDESHNKKYRLATSAKTTTYDAKQALASTLINRL